MSIENLRPETAGGPKYVLDIEGKNHDWDKSTITTEEIAQLGGWAVSQGVIQIDKDNNERTLSPGEVVELKPGMGFSKKVRWKRGGLWDDRVEEEMALLRTRYPKAERNAHWVRIPDYLVATGWNSSTTDVAFLIQDGHPGVAPYGLYVPSGLRFQGNMPKDYTEPASNVPPFGGTWGIFSWQPVPEEWKPDTDVRKGANLLNWVNGFAARFREGA